MENRYLVWATHSHICNCGKACSFAGLIRHAASKSVPQCYTQSTCTPAQPYTHFTA